MSLTLLKILADFDTQLATAASIGGTTATLVSATDDDGNALPTGTYGLTIDAGNSSKEYIVCTLTGTALTSILSITRQGVTSSGFARTHRRGAKVTVTDWAILSRMLNNLDGTTGFNSLVKLGYDADPGINSGDVNKFATVKFVNDQVVSGAPDASTTVKGITKLSTAPVSPTDPIAVGDNDTRVPTQAENDALVGNNTDIAVGTGNKFVTQTGLQKNAEKYAADAGANDTYVITLSPVPTSYTDGMVVYFKANTVNTGAATLNVNSLGAKTIVKGVNTTLANGDIAAGQFVTVIYDGTNFVLQNPTATASTNPYLGLYTNGIDTKNTADASATQNIAHGLGTTPKKINITFMAPISGSGTNIYQARLAYNGTTVSVVGIAFINGANRDMAGTDIVLYGPVSGNQTEFQTGVVTFDATNIIITWTKTNSPTGTVNMMWEAIA